MWVLLPELGIFGITVVRHLVLSPKSRIERPKKAKIGTDVAHVIRDLDTTFKVKRSKVNLEGAEYIVAASHTACYFPFSMIKLIIALDTDINYLNTYLNSSSFSLRVPIHEDNRVHYGYPYTICFVNFCLRARGDRSQFMHICWSAQLCRLPFGDSYEGLPEFNIGHENTPPFRVIYHLFAYKWCTLFGCALMQYNSDIRLVLFYR